MRKYQLIAFCLAGLLACLQFGCSSESQAESFELPEIISYNFDIRPILSDKCFKCHGPDGNTIEAGLRLDLPDSAYAPLKETKGAFAIVPGKPDESELLRRISSQDPDYQMPTPESHLGSLTPYQIELFRKWIHQGAKYEKHWAFVLPQKAPLPVFKTKEGLNNEIDYFIRARLKEKRLEPNPTADKERLLKRLAFDLTGLPPSEELMNSFLADDDPDAYTKIVDKLLDLPQYGEKMALHWLDLARYADSYGYQDDNIRTQWAWRDWLIHSFNSNMPYDQFVTWQLAGDMLPDATKEQVLATAFFRNHKYTEEGGVIPEEYRVEYVIDKTKTYGKAILGLTIECAQCHDHKYDPISQKDYFSIYAFFNNTKELGFEGDILVSKPAKKPVLTISDDDIRNMMQFINKKDSGNIMVSVMGERDTLRKTYLLNRGAYDQPGEEVSPVGLQSVMKYDTLSLPKNRIGLANWTVSKQNPLTARVFVNQLWQEFFGRGLVKTSGDFGMQGELPSHPELLDWLAVDFMENGWNIKRLVKQIVTSSTYQQSAKISKKSLELDPENIFLSHAPRNRLKAEWVRDMVLASSGLLVKDIGGPSVKPYQPDGLWETATSGRGELATYKQDTGKALYRRGMYTFIKLTVPPPSMMLFDASNRDQCEVKRLQTNTPLQALAMLNDPMILEASRVFAQRLLESDTNAQTNIQNAFHRIVCRKATKKELAILLKYYDEQLALFQSKKLAAIETLTVGEYKHNPDLDSNLQAALMKTIHLIYNMEESIVKT
ncbi:PSD1 and planctomycete cytochrome C domain-containing protein [Flavihumibacter sp. ZG627]|uniref:PSD1 and planctomycete cytochrome C domain-containing protein n=1 Tax=Flavihumibacter sp. ZG627 TaxID=1463156 RepID=UPI0005801512|nr:PSD1 and planctomycete cytochrome C domain-containing protein [Flavihumibacter sp. ZG627]KIC91445.1 cytochrome C [Flavihumibacter sp. ZG627]